LMESKPVRPGSEEYLDSEKYQIRHWDLERTDSLRELITLVNSIRRENAALQSDWSIEFHPTDNDQLICYSKQSPDKTNTVLVIINLDPHRTQFGFVNVQLGKLAIDVDKPYQAHDLLTGARYLWQGSRNFVQLDPQSVPGHIFRLRPRVRVESDFEYFL
jgi:starch synthase (maltosyl-transferring)